jgi:hypothetical protein
MNNIIKIVDKKNFFIIYINNRIFFMQMYLISNNKIFSNRIYTLFYIFKIMFRFGLVGPISKKCGY